MLPNGRWPCCICCVTRAQPVQLPDMEAPATGGLRWPPHPLLPLPSVTELLTQASRQAMGEMVHQIFSRLDVIPEPLDSPFAPAASTAVPRLQVSPAASRAGAVSLEAEAAGGGEGAAAGEDAAGAAAAAVAEADAAVAAAAGNTLDVAAAAGDGAAIAAAAADEAAAAAADELPPQPSPTTVLSLLPMVAVNHTEQEGYGVEAVREVLLFIISLIASGGWLDGWVGRQRGRRRPAGSAAALVATCPAAVLHGLVVNAAAWSTRGAACRCTLSCAAPASLPACPLHPIRCLQRPWALTRTCLRMAWT